jgi:hypothetical protein
MKLIVTVNPEGDGGSDPRAVIAATNIPTAEKTVHRHILSAPLNVRR